MPCQSYESNWASDSNDSKVKKLKAEADKLARIACKAMTVLEELEKEDFLLLKDDEVREWWQKHKEADRKEQARLAEKERRERIRAEALARLSDEEKELLGLANAKKSAGSSQKKTSNHSSPFLAVEDEDGEDVADAFEEWMEDDSMIIDLGNGIKVRRMR